MKPSDELRKTVIDQINAIFDNEIVESVTIFQDLTSDTKITIQSTPIKGM